jgi:hypothetical protein
MLKVSSSKKNSFTCGKSFLAFHLGGHVVGRALAPGVAAQRLRPQAEGALRRAAARGVERDKRMQQERHVVLGDVEVAGVDLGRPGHLVELLRRDLRTVGIVLDDAVLVLVADAEDLVQRLAVGKLHDGEVELAAADEVDRRALVQRLVGRGGHRRPDEAILMLG